MPKISRPILLLGLVGLVVISIIFFIKQKNDYYDYDAGVYFSIAKAIREGGILNVHESLRIRTFAYPLFLSLLIRVHEVVRIPTMPLIFLAQLVLYYLAILYITNVVYEFSKRLAGIVYLGLCCNIFVIPYLGIILTDSIYTSLSIVIFGLIIKVEALQQKKEIIPVKWLFFIIFITSLAITTRPAAIWLAIPLFYLLTKIIIQRQVQPLRVVIAIFLGATPLYFQIFLNVIHFQKFTFFPVYNLGAMHVAEGIKYIKYATWIGPGEAQNYYFSKALIQLQTSNLNIFWYFYHPLDAIKLLFVKLVGAFDFDFILAYPHSKEKIQWLASFFSFSIFWLGLLSIFNHLITNQLSALGSRYMPALVFLAWCSITLLSVLELRFTLPLICYFIISASALCEHIISTKNKKLAFIAIITWGITMPIFYSLSMFIRMQSVHFFALK